jgi:hypothetical protein
MELTKVSKIIEIINYFRKTKEGLTISQSLFFPKFFSKGKKDRPSYTRNGTIRRATTFNILIIGFIAGPAVSL